MPDSELEVKFLIDNLPRLENRLRSLDATLVYVRVFEVNLRFDTPTHELGSAHRVLRLRQDTSAHMTYKGPSQERSDVTARQEIEFGLDDFGAGRRLLEALGYQIEVIYEKYRTTYDLDGVKITLDELPFGHFCEVEGLDPASIQAASKQLGLDWDKRVMDSYLMLFGKLKAKKGWTFRDLTFANFTGIPLSPGDFEFVSGDSRE
jgi:adenylate cyclase class 2